MTFTSLQLLRTIWEIGAKLRPKKCKIMCLCHLSKLRKHFVFNYPIDGRIIGQENDSPEMKKYVSAILQRMFSVLFSIIILKRDYHTLAANFAILGTYQA